MSEEAVDDAPTTDLVPGPAAAEGSASPSRTTLMSTVSEAEDIDPAAPAAPAGSPPRAASAALWRVNTELRARNSELERELASLRAGAVVRRLTRGSASSSSTGSRKASLAGEPVAREDSTGTASMAAAQQLQEALRATEEQRATAMCLQDALDAARAEGAAALRSVDYLSQQLYEAQQAVADLHSELGAAQDGLAAAQEQLAAKDAEVSSLAQEAEGQRAHAAALEEELGAAKAELAVAQEAAATNADAVLRLEQEVSVLILEVEQREAELRQVQQQAEEQEEGGQQEEHWEEEEGQAEEGQQGDWEEQEEEEAEESEKEARQEQASAELDQQGQELLEVSSGGGSMRAGGSATEVSTSTGATPSARTSRTTGGAISACASTATGATPSAQTSVTSGANPSARASSTTGGTISARASTATGGIISARASTATGTTISACASIATGAPASARASIATGGGISVRATNATGAPASARASSTIGGPASASASASAATGGCISARASAATGGCISPRASNSSVSAAAPIHASGHPSSRSSAKISTAQRSTHSSAAPSSRTSTRSSKGAPLPAQGCSTHHSICTSASIFGLPSAVEPNLASSGCFEPQHEGRPEVAPQAVPPSQVFSVVMPPSADEVYVQAEDERQALQDQVAALEDRLAALEAELAEQLAAKQEAQQQVTSHQAQLAALACERDLLQTQAVSLQQEVSAFQQSSMLRGGASGAELALDPPLERAPSRTLASRMRELISIGRRSGSAASDGNTPSASRSPSRLSPGGSPSHYSGGGGAGSWPTSPHAAMPAVLEFSEAVAADGVQEVQQHPTDVAALQQALETKEVELEQQRIAAAEAAAALAEAQQRFDADAERLSSRMCAAEEAADAMLQLHSSPLDLRSPAAAGATVGTGSGHKQCRAAIECIYAQLWRERLGRQRLQAEAVELRLKLSQQQAHGAADDAVDAELDEASMQSLEQEMKRTDHLADELRRHKAHQLKLQHRAEQLELQLAEYNTLLATAEGVAQLPHLSSSTSPPATAGGKRTGGGGSPVQLAVKAVQVRKAVEEAAALREQLKAVHAEVISARRRERETATALKSAMSSKRAAEVQQAQLLNGLESLHRMLAKRAGQPATITATTGMGPRSGWEGSPASPGTDSALAMLSALLASVRPTEGPAARSAMESPQGSGNAGAGSHGAAGAASPSAVTSVLQANSEGAGAADPVDMSLLPDTADSGPQVLPGEPWGVEEASGVQAPAGTVGVAEEEEVSSGAIRATHAGPDKLAASSRTGSVQDESICAVPALLQKQGAAAVPLHASGFTTRIPAALPGSADATGSMSGGSPSKSSRIGALRKLALGLQTACSRRSPTKSSGYEVAAGGAQARAAAAIVTAEAAADSQE